MAYSFRKVGDSFLGGAWRFMGSYKWSYKSLNIGYSHSYPTYNPTYNYPWTSKWGKGTQWGRFFVDSFLGLQAFYIFFWVYKRSTIFFGFRWFFQE